MKKYIYTPEIHGRLTKIREAVKLNAREMSRRMGFSRSVYSKIETHIAEIREYHILLVCYTFHVNYDYLVFGEGEMFNKHTKKQAELLELFNDLSEPAQEQVLAFLRFLVSEQK